MYRIPLMLYLRWFLTHSWVFPKCFHWIRWIQLQIFVITVKGIEPAIHLLCQRSRCYHSASNIHVRDRIFQLISIHVSVIYQIRWIHRIHVPFRENSIKRVPVFKIQLETMYFFTSTFMSSCQKMLNTTNFLSVTFVLGLTKEVLKSC